MVETERQEKRITDPKKTNNLKRNRIDGILLFSLF